MAGRVLRAGESLGGYTVVRTLGAGGSGHVYLVKDDAGRMAALKSVDAHVSPVAAERLRREVRALMAVRHPAVPRVIDAELEDADTFVVFEFIEGMSLADHVAAHGPLAGEELAGVAQAIAGALEAAHAAGVVHRDVTPSNIMMSPHGAVLIDFGLSHRPDDDRLTRDGLVSGTAGFVAPEVIDGAEPGEAADRWALAATLAFAATGKAPFGVGNSAIRRTLAGKWSARGVPGGDVLAQALTLPVPQRPGMRDVVAALRGATVVLPTREAPPGEGEWDEDPDWLPADAEWEDLDGEQEGGDAHPDQAPWEEWDPDDASTELVLPAAGDMWDDWEPSPPRPVLIAAWLVVGAGIAALAPVLAVTILMIGALVAKTAYVRGHSQSAAIARRGVRKGDGLRLAVALPWHALKAFIQLLPAALTAIALGVGAGAGAWQIVSSGALVGSAVEAQRVGHASALAVGAMVAAGALWWGLWSWSTRLGAYRVAEWFAPTRAVSATWVVVAVVALVVIAAGVDLGIGPWWWPLPQMPGAT